MVRGDLQCIYLKRIVHVHYKWIKSHLAYEHMSSLQKVCLFRLELSYIFLRVTLINADDLNYLLFFLLSGS